MPKFKDLKLGVEGLAKRDFYEEQDHLKPQVNKIRSTTAIAPEPLPPPNNSFIHSWLYYAGIVVVSTVFLTFCLAIFSNLIESKKHTVVGG